MKFQKYLKELLNESKQSMLAHGNSRKTYTQKSDISNFKKFRVGQKVKFKGTENPNEKLEGKEGIIFKKDSNPRTVYVEFQGGGKYIIHVNDLVHI